MATYHQMGHDSENLLREPELMGFSGVILSPVNYDASEVAAQIDACRRDGRIESVFDPQLYVPGSDRGSLPRWPYFPQDVDSADLASEGWWDAVVSRIVEACRSLDPHAIASPVALPRSYSDEYFATSVHAGKQLVATLRGSGIQPIQTAVVALNDLAAPGRSMAVASILSQTTADRIYLVLVGTEEPRRELSDVEEIKGAMRLIGALSESGLRVMVGFCAADVLLWKFAGARDAASGKFFNLRRFSRSRFEEPSSGGGQLPYWFEEGLIAFLRESDLIRMREATLLSEASLRNPFGLQILTQLVDAPGTAWVAKGWRQYLWWFSDIEARLNAAPTTVPDLLRDAERVWLSIENTIFMEERQNEGNWLRAWRRACAEYAR
jgi:hypothetical protein